MISITVTPRSRRGPRELATILIAVSLAAPASALDPRPSDDDAEWWGEVWGQVSSDTSEIRPGDTFVITATAQEGGVGAPSWTWVDAGIYKASGTDRVTIDWTQLNDAVDVVDYYSSAAGPNVTPDTNSITWEAPPPHTAPAGSTPSAVPPPAAAPPRFGAGTTFTVKLKVRDPNSTDFPMYAWDKWKKIYATYSGNIGYLGWTDAAVTNVALKGGPSLKAELLAEPDDVAVDEPFTLKLKLINNGQYELTDVKPLAYGQNVPRIIAPDNSVEIVSGPSPASVASLPAGTSAEIEYEYKMKEETTATFALGAEGTCSQSGTPEDVTAGLATETVSGVKVITLVSVSLEESEDQINPGEQLSFRFKFIKHLDEKITLVLSPQQFFTADSLEMEVGLNQSETLVNGVIRADVTGEIDVLAKAKVADEDHQQIYTKVVAYLPGKINLANHRFFDAEYKHNGEQRLLQLFGTLNGKAIEFPNYAAQAGQLTGDPAPSGDEANYYRYGSTDPNMADALGSDPVPYYKSTHVRYVALKAIRGEGDDANTPDNPSVAVENLAKYLASKLTSQQDGAVSRTTTASTWLKNGAQLPPMSSVGQAQLMGSFARTIGLPAREVNNALRHAQGIFGGSPTWTQHAACQVWYAGTWHWFDLYYDMRNGNVPVTDTGYPGFYFQNGSVVSTYLEMKTYYATGQLNKDMYDLDPNGTGDPVDSGLWQLYKRWARDTSEAQNIINNGTNLHIVLHSPVTTLYVDAQGRRLGAAGPLNPLDLRTITETDDVEPVKGGGSVWEVPGGVYIAPNTPMTRSNDPNDRVFLEEQIIVPFDQMTETFKLIVTGVGSGSYRVQIWIDNGAQGTFDLYDYSSTIAEGQTETLEFTTDRSDVKPVITDGPAGAGANPNKDPSDTTGQEVPSAACCGAAPPSILLLITCCLMGGMKRRRRRRR
ncbi:MAG: transglutaminase domain-containing protein [Phycisphaerae bacterium]|nr:transglutaminase domain-containing protein [Phycisphaerae bacterium]